MITNELTQAKAKIEEKVHLASTNLHNISMFLLQLMRDLETEPVTRSQLINMSDVINETRGVLKEIAE